MLEVFTVPQPKFKIGQKVWGVERLSYKKRLPCPDCGGKKEWEVITPTGETFSVPCGTCESGFEGSHGYVTETTNTSFPTELTIARIAVDTARREDPVYYMCLETGCPSGSVHYEYRLFETKEEAKEAGERDEQWENARLANAEIDRQKSAKKKVRRKPTWEQRRIRELEKQLKQCVEQK